LPNNVLLKEKDLYKVSVTSSVYFSPVVEWIFLVSTRDRAWDVAFQNFLSNKKQPIRTAASAILGRLAAYAMNDKAFVDFVQGLYQMLKEKEKVWHVSDNNYFAFYMLIFHLLTVK
jgi:hypothetical protein